jgi:cardiolipin synthase
MARTLDFSAIAADTQQAIVDYVNRAPAGWYLTGRRTGGRTVDDPAVGYSGERVGYAIGPVVAGRIIDRRDALPGRQIASLADLVDIPGFGQDKLDDLAFTLSNLVLHRNTVDFFADGPACRRALLDLIDSAQNYIHFATFLFYDDPAGRAIADALAAKARDRVQVRVMLDRHSSEQDFNEDPALAGRHNIGRLIERMTDAGALVLNSYPISDRMTAAELESLADQGLPQAWVDEQLAIDGRFLLDANHADHEKMVVVDGRHAAILSCNIGDEYLYGRGSPRKGNGRKPHWHDAMTVIQGGAALRVHEQFMKRWFQSGGHRLERGNRVFDFRDSFFAPAPVASGSDTVYFHAGRPAVSLGLNVFDRPEPVEFDRNPIRQLYGTDLISVAQRDVIIQNPYPIDAYVFETWLMRMEDRPEVRFRLIRPSMNVNDYPLAHRPVVGAYIQWIFVRYDKLLLDAGARLHEFRPGSNHLKCAVVDDWLATHGSYNINYRSARKDMEFNLVAESKRYARQVRSVMRDDIDQSRHLRTPHQPSVGEREAVIVLRELGADWIIDQLG